MKQHPRERDALRRDSEYILEQAKWLYDLHAKRARSAQHRATAVMAFAGGLLALTPSGLDQNPSTSELVVFFATLGLSVATAALAMWSLLPRATEGPSIAGLRERWAVHSGQEGPNEQVHQNAEELLRSTDLDENSLLDFAKDDADSRVRRLKWAYWTLASALGAVSVLTSMTALTQ